MASVEVLLKRSGYTFTMGEFVGGGGMGDVFSHGTNDTMVAKTIREDFPVDKIEYLVAHPVVSSHAGWSFAWPQELGVSPDTGEPRCYILPKVENAMDIEGLYFSAHWLPDWFKYRVARNYVGAVLDLHRAGCFVGDMPNAMIEKSGRCTLIDIDSLQISRDGAQFNCGVAKEETIAPELIPLIGDGGGTEFETTVHHDEWGTAVVIFRLLLGNHPFAFRYLGSHDRPQRIELVEKGIWPYAATCHPDYAPRRGATPLNVLDPELRLLFTRTFVSGHSSPNKRSTLEDWNLALTRLVKEGAS